MVTVSEFKRLLQKNLNELIWRNKGWGPIPIFKKGEKGFSKQDIIEYHTNKIKQLEKEIFIAGPGFTTQYTQIKNAWKEGKISETEKNKQLAVLNQKVKADIDKQVKLQAKIDKSQEAITKLQPSSEMSSIIKEAALSNFGEKYHESIASKLTKKEVSALYDYKSIKYKQINARARGSQINHDTDITIANIDSALNKTSLPKNVTVYRGVRSDIMSGELPTSIQAVVDNPKDAIGRTLSDSAFMSTSLSKQFSQDWVGVAKKQVFMTIKVPKGSKALYLDAVSDAGEFEMLLPRNSKFKIKNIRTVSTSITELDVDLVK